MQSAKNKPLLGKKVLVVGGSSGIGLSIVKKLADSSCEIHIASSSNHSQPDTATAITFHTTDILDNDAIQTLATKVGSLDYLIVTAGSASATHLIETSMETAYALFELNVWSKLRLIKAFEGKISRSGGILLLSGIYGKKVNHQSAINSMAAAAVNSLVKVAAKTLSPIRVNGIAPYSVRTDENQIIDKNKLNQLPSKYIGNTDDIAQILIATLINPYMTGCVIEIDGGYSL